MYKRESQGWLKHLDFIIADCICLNLSLILAYAIRHQRVDLYQNINYRNIAIVLTIIDILTAIFFNSFKNVLKRGYYIEFLETLKHVSLVEGFIMLYLFSTQQGDTYSRITFYLLFPIYLLSTYLIRIMRKRNLRSMLNRVGRKSLLIVASERDMEQVIKNVKATNYGLYKIPGIVLLDIDKKVKEIQGIPVVAEEATVTDYICRQWVDEVLFVVPTSREYPIQLIEDIQLMGVTVHVTVARMPLQEGKRTYLEQMGEYMVLTSSIRFATPGQACIKRVLDIIGSLMGCVITLLLCIIFGPIIYMQSPGPIFFKQTRVGYNGKKFTIYKFRTMYLDAEEHKKELMEKNRVKDGMMFKLDFDPRIIGNKILPDGSIKTGIGDFMRRTSIDEWPQMFNVLKGDMSLVGTRPPTVDEWEKYKLHHRARLAIKPGITGMWQVSGRSNITDFEEVVKLDTEYIDQWNMGLDFKILFKTMRVIWKKEGSL